MCGRSKVTIAWLLGAAIWRLLPAPASRVLAQSAICGQFADVPSSSVFCPYILEAFVTGITQGTSPSTFAPDDVVSRDQAATLLARTMDQTLSRAAVRIAIAKPWNPGSPAGGIATDVGGPVNDIIADATYLWIARGDGKVLKLNAADRRLLETWTLSSGSPQKLGMFAGQMWILDEQARLQTFNPSSAPTSPVTLFTSAATGVIGGDLTLAFDGANVWMASSFGPKIFIYPPLGSSGTTITVGANVDGMIFDGTYMWVLLADSTLVKMSPPAQGAPPAAAETVVLPGAVNDCRMVYDGSNIWVPVSVTGTLYVVRPSLNQMSPSLIVQSQAIPDVAQPFVAAFDGEHVLIGGSANGAVALYQATNLSLIGTFPSGAIGVRSIASDGRTFSLGDYLGTRFYQF